MNNLNKCVRKQIPTPTKYQCSSVARRTPELEDAVNSPRWGRPPRVVSSRESWSFLRRLNATDGKTSLGWGTSADAARGDGSRMEKGDKARKDYHALPLSPPAVASAGSRLPSLRSPSSPPHQDWPVSPWRGNQTFCQRRGRKGLIKGGWQSRMEPNQGG